MSNKQVTGYTVGWGTRKQSVWEHTGPASYVTGGESLLAIWIEFIELVWVSPPSPPWTYSGTYSVVVLYPSGAGGITSGVTLKWYVTATGMEVDPGTDLSGETIRLLIQGA